MKLFTREEKRDKELMKEYNTYINEGISPRKAVKKAKEKVRKKIV